MKGMTGTGHQPFRAILAEQQTKTTADTPIAAKITTIRSSQFGNPSACSAVARRARLSDPDRKITTVLKVGLGWTAERLEEMSRRIDAGLCDQDQTVTEFTE